MKSKYLAFLLLRLFSIVYFTIYSIPSLIFIVSILTSGGPIGFGLESISLFLSLIIGIIIPVAIWYWTDYLSSKIIHSKDDGENQFGLEASSYICITTLLIGLVFIVKAIPVLVAISYSKIFIGGYFNQTKLSPNIYQVNTEFIQPIIEILIGLSLIIFNKSISNSLNKLSSLKK